MATPDTNPRPQAGEPEKVPADQVPKTEREGLRVLSSRRRMKRGRLWFLIGAALVLLVGGFFLWRYFASYESTDDAQVDVHLYPVSGRISGYVINVNVNDNQYVEKGTVLVEIDPRDYQVAVDKARADLAMRGSHRAVAQYHCSHHFREYLEPVEVRRVGRGKRQRRNHWR